MSVIVLKRDDERLKTYRETSQRRSFPQSPHQNSLLSRIRVRSEARPRANAIEASVRIIGKCLVLIRGSKPLIFVVFS